VRDPSYIAYDYVLINIIVHIVKSIIQTPSTEFDL